VGKIAVAKACKICRHSVAACAENLSRSAVDMSSVGSHPVLAFAQFGEHRDGIAASHAEPGLDIGIVGAKKRIRRKLDCDRRLKATTVDCRFNQLKRPKGPPLTTSDVDALNVRDGSGH
jgi:hypothetical protein